MSEVSLTILFVITCDSGLYLSDANHDSAPAERVINKNPPPQYFFLEIFLFANTRLSTPFYCLNQLKIMDYQSTAFENLANHHRVWPKLVPDSLFEIIPAKQTCVIIKHDTHAIIEINLG